MAKIDLIVSISLLIAALAIFIFHVRQLPSSDEAETLKDYTQYDSSICLWNDEVCTSPPPPPDFKGVLRCLSQSGVLVYFLKQGDSCAACQLSPGIVFPADAPETSAAVKCFAAHPEVEFRTRSGGHSFSGTSWLRHGFVLDMVRVRSIRLVRGPVGDLVEMGVGAKVGEVYRALEPHGLLLSGGDCPSVGIGGLSSCGGTGFATRKHGVLTNTVESYQLVLATGHIVNASLATHRDLFHVMRGGGGGSFGVITHVTARVFPLEENYGLIRLRITGETAGKWLHYFLNLADTLTEDVMYLYTYLFDDSLLCQGAIPGETSSKVGRNILADIVDNAKSAGVSVSFNELYRIKYPDLYKYTYGENAFPDAIKKTLASERDFRHPEKNRYSGSMSGYICEELPLEIAEEITDYFYNSDERKNLKDARLGVNVELFGGRKQAEERNGVYRGRNCWGIITTYPIKHDNPDTYSALLEFQAGFWRIVRPYTRNSYRGYEDRSHGTRADGRVREMMEFAFGEDKERVMRVKSEYDPNDIFHHDLSVPTLECYHSGKCKQFSN